MPDHYNDLLKFILSKYKDKLRKGNLILITDSQFGSADNVERLFSIPKLKFITKTYSTRTASNLAKDTDYAEYTQVDEAAWFYELPQNNRIRHIIVQTLSSKGKLEYFLLCLYS